MMIEPTAADIGRQVIYQGGHPDDREEGVITSFNAACVFVRFGRKAHSECCGRADLSWSHAPPLDTRV